MSYWLYVRVLFIGLGPGGRYIVHSALTVMSYWLYVRVLFIGLGPGGRYIVHSALTWRLASEFLVFLGLVLYIY